MSERARTVSEIDWATWKPLELGTLCFVVRRSEMLLMRKKRGLGAGKIVAPGGRVEVGETPHACAIREVQEELCVTPVGVVACGEHRFQFVDGYSIHVFAFRAADLEGEPRETDEGLPLWTRLDQIPYEQMWADNRLWLPLMLAGVPFSGRYVFEDDRMLDHAVARSFSPPR